ncbi:MAG: hypothetical protein U1E55_13045 [Paracoccus sp. (in: a-proteobacteria)]
MHNNKRKIETVADMKGLKIRVPGSYVADLVGALGATPLFMSSPEVYEKLSRRVIDGVAFTYEAMTAFNLVDDIKYSMTVPGGIYKHHMVLCDQRSQVERAERRGPRRHRSAVGRSLCRTRVGQAERCRQRRQAEIGDKVDFYQASPEIVAALKAKAGELEQKWSDGLGQGYDGMAALAAFRKETGVDLE